jgi:hypothetical protein
MMTRFSRADLTDEPRCVVQAAVRRPARTQTATPAQAAIIDFIYAVTASVAMAIAIFGLLTR